MRRGDEVIERPGYVVHVHTNGSGRPKLVDKGECPHGKRPWWDCPICQKAKTYAFTGNFR